VYKKLLGGRKVGWIKNVVTMGAAARIEKRAKTFEIIQSKYNNLYIEMEEKRNKINSTLEKLIKVKVESVKSLKKLHKLSKKVNLNDQENLNNYVNKDFATLYVNRINNTLSTAYAAINATGGISVGIGSAVGAWALVSTFGIASTGTAIVGISGVAATNATLAWFGGGALAAGGGGMAAGVSVLGGIVAIPALVLTGVLSHMQANKKIKVMDEKTIELNEAIKKLNEVLITLEEIYNASYEKANNLINNVENSRNYFDLEFKRVYKQIYKWPVISRIYKIIRKNIFRRGYYSKQDIELIAYIYELAINLSILVEQKIFVEKEVVNEKGIEVTTQTAMEEM
jgi:hypothetical protein